MSDANGGIQVGGLTQSAGMGRREVLRGGAVLLGALLVPTAARSQGGFQLSAEARSALEQQPLVYISPLRSDGTESRCHGEVWYFVDQGDVVIGTDAERWKARSVKAGRDRARIWVPKSPQDKGYQGGHSFEARARPDSDRAAFDRLVAKFAVKYKDEWESTWGPRFRESYANGSRILLRYTPAAA